MKKHSTLAAAAVAIIGTGTYFGLKAQNSERGIDSVVANIEALADEESWSGSEEYSSYCIPCPCEVCVISPYLVIEGRKSVIESIY